MNLFSIAAGPGGFKQDHKVGTRLSTKGIPGCVPAPKF